MIGEGEEGRPPHPRRNELTRLLLERGANPYDMQVFYNIHFKGDVLWLLKLIYEHSVKTGRQADWDDPAWSMIGMGGYGEGARYFLTIAIDHDDLELAEWCLSHGADPNAMLPRDVEAAQESERARSRCTRWRCGAGRRRWPICSFASAPTSSDYVPSDEDRFVAACLRLDRAEAQRLAARHPEFIRSSKAMFEATRRNNVEAMRLLIELGASIEVQDETEQRPLHVAAWSNSIDAARFLIEAGAQIDPVETNWSNSPIDFARWSGYQAIIDLLAPHSRDIWSLAFTGKVDRLRELLTADPSLAKWELVERRHAAHASPGRRGEGIRDRETVPRSWR